MVHLESNDQNESTMPREVEIRGFPIRDHQRRNSRALEDVTYRKLEQEQSLAQCSDPVEYANDIDDSRRFGVHNELVPEENE